MSATVATEGRDGAAAVDGAAAPGPARTLGARIGRGGQYLAQSLRLMVGLPDYDAYLGHMERTHPDQAPMSYAAFFRERQDARYGTGGRMSRCC